MIYLLLILSAFLPAPLLAQEKETTGSPNDTLNMLCGNGVKYWDRVDTTEKWSIKDNIHYSFFSDKTMMEYTYSPGKHKKREEYVYGGDVLFGKIPFSLCHDTLVFLNHSTHIILLLSNDSLITVQILNGILQKKAVYVSSKDQKQTPRPFEKPRQTPKKRKIVRHHIPAGFSGSLLPYTWCYNKTPDRRHVDFN